MQTFGIVAISVVAGLMLAILLAGIGITIFFSWRVRVIASTLQQRLNEFYAENSEVLAAHREQLGQIAESAKSNFKGIREEMRGSLELTFKTMQETLSAHEKIIAAAVSQINANQLLEASRRGIAACGRLERVVAAIDRWRIEAEETEGEEPPNPGQPWPDSRATEYAPTTTGESIYGKRRPEDVLDSQKDEGERIPVGL